MHKRTLSLTLICLSLTAADRKPQFTLTPELQSSLDQISADSMRGNLSFLASDLLEGRDTPSRGLDIAAEFIAAQFRAAQLEPGGNDGYFQTARMYVQQPNLEGFSLTFEAGGKSFSVTADQAQVHVSRALDLAAAPLFKLDLADTSLVDALGPGQLDGKVVITEFTRGAMRSGRKAMGKVRASKPALVVMLERKASDDLGRASGQLFDPEDKANPQSPRITISGKEAVDFYDGLKPGLAKEGNVTARVAAPKEQPVTLRNVVGILRGSDPVLKNSCVLVSAHYDHIGMKPSGDGDRIYNGANDDGSGTVSVIELARALSRLNPHPKRSIVFITFFGEEKGGFGSRYYAGHPAIPLKDTVADINLEQVGRTDSTEGAQIANASLTGYDYSDVAGYLKEAGRLSGVKLYQHAQNSDLYFAASDNISLADKGVPAHSLSVAFNYPDYHGLGDEWQKIDYANMAKVDRTVAVALVMIASSPEIPHWNADNPKAEKYLNVWKETHGQN